MEKITLYDYQIEGVNFLLKNKKAILADEMGLGKTIQAISAINKLNASKILIICPAIVKLNWQNELQRWLNRKLNICVVFSNNTTQEEIDQANIVIINYDILKKYNLKNHNAFVIRKWDVLILDEAHKIKELNTSWTKYILGTKLSFGILSDYTFLLTGTPIKSYNYEIYPLLLMCNYRQTFINFTKRYCNRHFAFGYWNIKGRSN